MSEKYRKYVLAAVAVIAAFFYYASESMQMRGKKMRSPTSFSDGAFGLSQLLDFRRSLKGRQTLVWRKAFLQTDELKAGDTIVIASPLRPVSGFESNNLLESVQNGTNLYLSSHSKDSLRNIQGIIDTVLIRAQIPRKKAAEAELQLVDDEFFKQKEFTFHDSSSTDALLQTDDKLAFYSVQTFATDLCSKADPAHCYFHEFPYGKGKIWLQLGPPLFANAFMSQVDNRKIAARLSAQSQRLILDEYHQLFEESDLGDFLTDPYIALPLLGFVVICLLAAAMSNASEVLPKPSRAKGKVRSWTMMTIGMLQNQLRFPVARQDAVLLQIRVLLRSYPELREAVRPFVEACSGEASATRNYAAMHLKLNQLQRQARINRGVLFHEPTR